MNEIPVFYNNAGHWIEAFVILYAYLLKDGFYLLVLAKNDDANCYLDVQGAGPTLKPLISICISNKFVKGWIVVFISGYLIYENNIKTMFE